MAMVFSRAAAPVLLFFVFSALLAPPVAAQDTDDEATVQDAADDAPDVDVADPLELKPSVVTGSRLSQGDSSARVLVVTAEQIAARGLSSLEDVIRTIPQIFSSINGTTYMNFGSDAVDRNLGPLAVGISTANLRGFGSANTLVLLNGQRMAGAAGAADFYINLRNLPAGSIERIEVNLDGGGSVYGSDGVAGIINIITRKQFRGGKVTARSEQSSTGADQTQYSAYLGYNWDDGGVSTNLSRTKSEPYSTRKAGYYTRDWSFMFGGDQAYNFNLSRWGRPLYTRSARIGLARWGPFYLTLPEGNDGRNAQPADFRYITAADAIEVIDQDAGGSTYDKAITLNIEQTFAGKLRLRGEYMRTESETATRLTRLFLSSFKIPESNAFNNIGRDIYVQYDPQTEIDLGLIPTPEQTSAGKSDRILAGIDFDLKDNMKLTANWLKSGSSKYNNQWTFASRSDRDFPEEGFGERVEELLASSDPSVAINLIGDGTGQNPTIAEMFSRFATISQGTELTKAEAYLQGTLFDMPGGTVGFVIGGERRKEENQDDASGYFESLVGLERPYRKLDAFFVELRAPVFGKQNARTGFQSLVLTASARRDNYHVEGSVESRDGMPLLSQSEFSNSSLGLGFKWFITQEFSIRARLDEAFRAPTAVDLFGGTTRLSTSRAYDPLIGEWVPGAWQETGPNPDLRPEYSDNASIGVSWQPRWAPGLALNLDYSEIDFQDRIANSWEIEQLVDAEVFAQLGEFFERDPETGALIGRYYKSVNITRRLARTWDLDISWQLEAGRFGIFTPSIYFHYVDNMFDQPIPGAPSASFVGEIIGIDKKKVRGHLEWIKDRLTVNLFFDYTPSYLNNHYQEGDPFATFFGPRIPDARIENRYTVDLSGTYSFDNGWTIRAGGRNIFDADFPFALNFGGKPYDATRVDVRGQVWFFELTYDFDW